MIDSINDYENWRDSLHDNPLPEPDEHQYRFYTHDYPADTTLEYTRKDSRSELTLSFGSDGPDMGSEEMVLGGDHGESMAELVSELKSEIQSYLNAADTSSFYDQQGEPAPIVREYGEYSRTALYAFEAILNETEKELQQKLTWKPVEADHVGWLYSSSRDNDLERGCVGHLRGDFGKSGGEFWVSWFDHQPKLKSTAFHDALQNAMSGLREKGGLLHDFASMSRGCRDGLRYEESFNFKADTPNYAYYLRCIPRRGDYNFYLYVYDKAAQLERAKEKAIKQPDTKLHWETYKSELEAIQRKAYIDYLEKNGLKSEIIKAALEYKRKAEIQKRVKEEIQFPASTQEPENVQKQEENLQKTYRQFVEKWLPIHARKKRFSPNTYDNYRSNLNNHILPYFGDQIMSSITAEDIDNFIDYLSSKPCKGSKTYGKKGKEIPLLASSSIKKCYNVLMAGFPSAKKWHYVNEVPETTPPSEKAVKRHAWTADKVKKVLDSIQDDKLLHLAVHLAFVCSLRAGETAGIDVNTIDAADHSFWITRQIQRVSDVALEQIPQEEIFRVFPKQVAASRSSLILKTPKTEGSKRKQYVPAPLMKEIMERVAEIEEHKAFFQEEYHDYGLLICQVDGRPIDPKSFDKWFKEKQTACGIPPQDQIEFQGLRKSGQMHKVRLSQNNYQLVAESAGQSPEVLMSNYNEALDSEKRALSHMVEDNFYSEEEREQFKPKAQPKGMDTIMEMLRDRPELAQQLMQNLLLGALNQTASAPHKKSSC